MIKRIVKYINDESTSEYPLTQSVDHSTPTKVKSYKMFTTKVRVDLTEKLEQQAYWEQKNIMDVVELALIAHFEGRSFEPVPEDTRSKNGRKRLSRSKAYQ